MREPKKVKMKKVSQEVESSKKGTLIDSLGVLASKRTGGSNNIRGIEFQLLYSCDLILQKLIDDTVEIRLEGIEDIDCIGEIDTGEFIQLKTSKNIINASDFWDMKVLQNFMEAYRIEPRSKFRLVHNSNFSKGKLDDFSSSNLSEENIAFWKNKFNSENINIAGIDFKNFLQSITIEPVNEKILKENCLKNLITHYNLTTGTEIQYFNTLFNFVLQGAKDRITVIKNDIDLLLQSTLESFSKHPINTAIQNGYISPVVFEPGLSSDLTDYFDGKAAKPIHIANNLPVKRPDWETEIETSISTFDITLIKASSGQGKSTLAWLTSKTLADNGYSVFELHYCADWNDANSISEFIKSRLKIGQIPLIVLDGLNNRIKGWGLLAEKFIDFPVKFLITSRAEDWTRFGHDLSKIKLKPIDIKLSFDEASKIYAQLKKQNKLHNEINNWQPAWEKIKDKGLLIEYVYLLTKGQMITDRITDQIKQLNADDVNAGSKTEILRIISLADVMNIKLQTSKITDHIHATVKFSSDRNEVYRQLENEYYIRFDDTYVEGLHPIRSQHLVDILHSSISLTDTVISLFALVDDIYIYDYFSSLPFLIIEKEKTKVYEKIADHLAKKSFEEIALAIDGLMKVEAKRYQQANKEVFDEIAKSAGIELFIYDTLPFTKLNLVEGLAKTMNIEKGYDLAKGLKDKLTAFSIADSEILLFIHQLKPKLKTRVESTDFKYLSFLAKWFRIFGLEVPKLIEISEDELLHALKSKRLSEAIELFSYYQIVNPENYKVFIAKNKAQIFSLLKIKTNSITIEEQGENINIEYFFDNNEGSVNECSVKRIDAVYEFLPDYERYCTEVIVLPYPNAQIHERLVQESVKKMSKEYIKNTFDTHINQIWLDTILTDYRLSSVYEWQKQYFELRKAGLEFAKRSTRVFEAHIENDAGKIRSCVNKWKDPYSDLMNALASRKKIPKYEAHYYENSKLEHEEKGITDWSSSLNNFVNQIAKIIEPKGSNDRNLARRNLQAVVYKLAMMQLSYTAISESTFNYFPDANLCEDEKEVYIRLYNTVLYYIHRIENNIKSKVIIANKYVDEWIEKDTNERLKHIKDVVEDFEILSDIKFYLPTHIIYDENLTTAVIGIEGFDFTQYDESFLDLVKGLVDFSKSDVDFFSFVYVKNKEVFGGFRVTKYYFKKIDQLLETGEFEKEDYGNPHLIIPTLDILLPLNGIQLRQQTPLKEHEAFEEMMSLIGKLIDYRERLDQNSKIEMDWLANIEKEYREKIEQKLITAQEAFTNEEKVEYDKFIKDFVAHKIKPSKEEIVEMMNSIFTRIAQESLFKIT
jgi:hypothetical protein